jgi:tRNA(Ile2) C34 agmatinyltransferase TiaS
LEKEEERRQPACPCCGTRMAVASETETRLHLRCPACLVSDLRMKQDAAGRRL